MSPTNRFQSQSLHRARAHGTPDTSQGPVPIPVGWVQGQQNILWSANQGHHAQHTRRSLQRHDLVDTQKRFTLLRTQTVPKFGNCHSHAHY